MNPSLIIIDAHAILHRAYHALPDLTSPGGQPTGAVYGFFKMVLGLMADFSSPYLFVAFDSPPPNFRHQKFVGYQAKRPQTDRCLLDQISLTKKVLDSANIAFDQKDGFEADDIIGTVSDRVGKKMAVLIVTGDKDLMQLVNRRVNLFFPKNGLSGGQIVDPDYVKQDLTINPSQVVDYKGLIGDNSDNYPGALGIGPKTGSNLLNQFGDLKTIYQNLDQVKPSSVAEKLVKYQEDVFLSADLAKIDCQVPFKFNLADCLVEKIDLEQLKLEFKNLGFRSLLAELVKKDKQMNLF